jgi:hypothetical protein
MASGKAGGARRTSPTWSRRASTGRDGSLAMLSPCSCSLRAGASGCGDGTMGRGSTPPGCTPSIRWQPPRRPPPPRRRKCARSPLNMNTPITTYGANGDPLNRLTAADYSSGEYFHFSYDAVGNAASLRSRHERPAGGGGHRCIHMVGQRGVAPRRRAHIHLRSRRSSFVGRRWSADIRLRLPC